VGPLRRTHLRACPHDRPIVECPRPPMPCPGPPLLRERSHSPGGEGRVWGQEGPSRSDSERAGRRRSHRGPGAGPGRPAARRARKRARGRGEPGGPTGSGESGTVRPGRRPAACARPAETIMGPALRAGPGRPRSAGRRPARERKRLKRWGRGAAKRSGDAGLRKFCGAASSAASCVKRQEWWSLNKWCGSRLAGFDWLIGRGP
jgi:hypothetical protein